MLTPAAPINTYLGGTGEKLATFFQNPATYFSIKELIFRLTLNLEYFVQVNPNSAQSYNALKGLI